MKTLVPETRAILEYIAEFGPCTSPGLIEAGFQDVHMRLNNLRIRGFVFGEPTGRRGHYAWSASDAARRGLAASKGQVTPPRNYVTTGLYVPPVWGYVRPGAGDALGCKSVGLRT